jgi:hypothetical protein
MTRSIDQVRMLVEQCEAIAILTQLQLLKLTEHELALAD